MAVGQGLHQGPAGFAVAANQMEGRGDPADPPGETPLHDGAMEGAVLEQGDEGADGVDPGHHGGVDGQTDPEPLGIGKGVWDLAETDGRGRVAHQVEGVEDAHGRGGVARGVLAWNQRQPGDGHARR